MRALWISTLILIVTSASTVQADESGYLGVGQPWIVAVGGSVHSGPGAGVEARIGHRMGDVTDVRVVGEIATGRTTTFAECLVMPIGWGRFTLGNSLGVGVSLRERPIATLVRVSIVVAYRPFAVPAQSVCAGCPVPNEHSPLQIELGLGELNHTFTREPVNSFGASLRVAYRF